MRIAESSGTLTPERHNQTCAHTLPTTGEHGEHVLSTAVLAKIRTVHGDSTAWQNPTSSQDVISLKYADEFQRWGCETLAGVCQSTLYPSEVIGPKQGV